MKTCSVILLWLLLFASASVTFADCYCSGCGCKGGPGWRVRATGECAYRKRMRQDCGDPPNSALCEYEGAKQVCPSEGGAQVKESFPSCYCSGCGCKGGPGWRVRAIGECVSWKRMKKDCGDPPNSALCAYEGAKQVCPR
jgi:hypothetical protein